NAGEGRIARAMKRYNIDDYWGLSNHRRALKRETRDYVPKYLAAMLIAKDPEKYGFDKLNYQDPVKHETVIITQATDLRVIAKASGVTLKEIRKLNPELKRWFTPPNAPKYELKVPLGSAIKYTENIKDIPKKDRLRFQRHKVKRGESLWSISRRYNTPINQIMYLNNLKRSRVIRAGKTIVVPVRAGNYKNKSKKGKRYASVKVSSGDYVVKKGDTLWDISIKYGISLNKLIKLNKLKKTAPLRPGQRLNLKEAHLQNKTTRGL
ncbi:MAG: LysM peptidoglycan-binding domain-containing protein, partial [Deltaproteobacteria bacterium]|nr:LysM peptidoglycan-binding domain-containing protein [Deltaproteobacteria bacterium]